MPPFRVPIFLAVLSQLVMNSSGLSISLRTRIGNLLWLRPPSNHMQKNLRLICRHLVRLLKFLSRNNLLCTGNLSMLIDRTSRCIWRTILCSLVILYDLTLHGDGLTSYLIPSQDPGVLSLPFRVHSMTSSTVTGTNGGRVS